MEKLEFRSSRVSNYPIYIGSIYDKIMSNPNNGGAFIVDRLVYKYHKDLINSIRMSRPLIIMEAGEKAKSFSRVLFLVKKLHHLHISRNDTIFALGGGSITDLVGFLASIYMRGIPYVNLPSTLIGQLDASVGGKTGINIGRDKNICGSFHNPSAVIIDPLFLQSLSTRHLRGGIAEAIKVAVIGSDDLFKYIENNLGFLLNVKIDCLQSLIKWALEMKIQLLINDPFENNLDRALNFGHTIGHAIELLPNRKLTHGEAISIGMATSVRFAMHNHIIDITKGIRIIELLKKTGLPINLNISKDEFRIINHNLDIIRMIRGGKLRFVVPNSIGSCMILDNIQITHKLISDNTNR